MQGNKYIRKLTVTGQGKSYYVTLPLDLIKALKWKKGEKKVVYETEGKIIIKDWVPSKGGESEDKAWPFQ